jgi:hypothetical protein
LQGFIDYRKWENNPQFIGFKSKLNESVTLFSPKTIKGFVVEGDAFESAVVKSKTFEINSYKFSYEKEFATSEDTVFLQALVKGTKSLYFLKKRGLTD